MPNGEALYHNWQFKTNENKYFFKFLITEKEMIKTVLKNDFNFHFQKHVSS